MQVKKIQVGIIGLGYVGGAVRHWFDSKKDLYDLYLYDKYKKIGSVSEVNKADIIFIAVPTPFHEDNGGYDDSAIRETLENIKDGKIVVIKSSVLPGSTDKFQKDYPQKTLLFNPEFLTAESAVADFLNPHRQIVGYTTEKSKEVAPKILDILPHAQFSKIIRAKEAEMVKFFGNTFLAMRVIFANQIYDLCAKLGIDYKAVKECAGHDMRIGHSHFDIFHEGYRGYGGMCLPKDTRALLQLAEKIGVDLELLKKVEEINSRLRGESIQTTKQT